MTVGFALCGSFCTHARAVAAMECLRKEGHTIIPIVSGCVASTDTRFGRADTLLTKLESICERRVISTIRDAEPLGPAAPMDAMIIAPCTGNTLAKLAAGITDTSVTMAAKAHLRANRPLLIAAATNDALSANLENIARLYRRKYITFVPLLQDDVVGKPHSLVAQMERIPEAFAAMMEGKQLLPLFEVEK